VAASASSSSGSSRTWVQNIDISELQKFQLNKDNLQKGRLVAGGASYSSEVGAAQKIDLLRFVENSAK
jgi:hypothetical protein